VRNAARWIGSCSIALDRVAAVYEKAAHLPNIRLRGIQMHIGSQITDGVGDVLDVHANDAVGDLRSAKVVVFVGHNEFSSVVDVDDVGRAFPARLGFFQVIQQLAGCSSVAPVRFASAIRRSASANPISLDDDIRSLYYADE
jgi:hypothetical protein